MPIWITSSVDCMRSGPGPAVERARATASDGLARPASRSGIAAVHERNDQDHREREKRHAFAKTRIEAGLRIARFRLLRQGDRALGQALEHEAVEVAAFDQFDGGLDAVVRVAGAATDAERTAARGPEARLSVTHASR